MANTYTISDLAREFDVTTRTIRFYEDKGLIVPERRGQTRLYSAADRTKLKLILRGKRLGLSLDESRQIIDMYNPGTNNADQLNRLIGKIQERKALLEAQKRDLDQMLQELDDAEQRCRDALQ
ncbi:MerR family transcriptional regulator [Simiduia agarivorans]|uniref:MerR family transcriptional regulator n=1 Tax=Simiduia agarivorans (strain DSM 21679 / JCM 13881 / BCRC 17597 / SA1) TaxID=1117647 RepID=K4KZ63_SIMAS|nr:MerR family DNA-binding transcriptional regulator [Simiduia agarivorans]AFU99192.1 MerR family transcriptional regulator [Simiduia agarivorans SA1 = DSM 21679]